MAFDVVEDTSNRSFRVWGSTAEGASVLLSINNFTPYLYIAAPKQIQPQLSAHHPVDFQHDLQSAQDVDWERSPQLLCTLRSLFNRTIPVDSRIQYIEPVHRRPILYYRPGTPDGGIYLKLVLPPGGNTRRAGNEVLKMMTNRGGLREYGVVWRDQTLYEHEVSPLQRVLADVPISSGAWLCISPPPPPPQQQPSAQPQPPSPVVEQGHRNYQGGGFFLVPPPQRISSADIEVVANWQSIVNLTPDATQLSDAHWSPFAALPGGQPPSAAAAHAAGRARRGEIAPLRMVVLDVCCATRDGVERAPVAAQGDPIVTISCVFQQKVGGTNGESKTEKGESTVVVVDEESDHHDIGGEGEGEGDDGDEASSARIVAPSVSAVAAVPRSARRSTTKIISAGKDDGEHAHAEKGSLQNGARPVVFVLASTTTSSPSSPFLREFSNNADVVVCATEAELLLTWQDYMLKVDPDVISLFQVGHSLSTIAQRFKALNLPSNNTTATSGLSLSRMKSAPAPMQIKQITMYSAAWVRSQARMSSTSNQETFRAEIQGRLVVDVLRQVLTSSNLASFSLVDCVQSILGETMEVLGAHRLATLAGVVPAPTTTNTTTTFLNTTTTTTTNITTSVDALRLARYSLRRAAAVHALLERLATIEDAIEMARATGLTIAQVCYNAQMIRTSSLLLRAAQRHHYIVNSRAETAPLSETTFILHPVEAGN